MSEQGRGKLAATTTKPPAARRFRIGTLASRTGRSVHTIRWYEAQGLIPDVERDPGGRRIYQEGHVAWLYLMQRLRLTGMSIDEMRAYTLLVKQGRSSLSVRRDLLIAHRQRVEQTLAEWAEALQLLEQKIQFYEQWLVTGTRPSMPPPAGLEAPNPTRRRRA